MASSNSGDSVGSPVKKKVRGSTKLRSLVARHGEQQASRVHVEFDDDLNLLGPDGDKFISYVGFLGRSKVSILIPTWREVSKDTKAMIWEQLLVCKVVFLSVSLFLFVHI